MNRSPKAIYEVADRNDLNDLVAKLDQPVPERLEGRTKDHTENYIFVRVLDFLRREGVDFPLRIFHEDRPDFRIDAGSKVIGVEIVEVSSTNEVEKDILRTRETELDYHFVESAIPGEELKTAEQLRAELAEEVAAHASGEQWGDGAVGSPWHEWAQAIAYFAAKKAEKAAVEGFKLFDENWLAMYDNWPVIMGEPNWARMSGELLPMFDDNEVFSTFDRVFVVRHRHVLMLTKNDYRVEPSIDHGSN